MKKREIIVEIHTDDSGVFCDPFRCFVAGCYCEVLKCQTEKVPGTFKAMRCQQCLDAEIKK